MSIKNTPPLSRVLDVDDSAAVATKQMLFCDICKTKVFPSVFGACSQCHAQTVGGCSICFPCALQTGALSFRQYLFVMFEGKCASCGSSFSSPTKTTEIVAQAPVCFTIFTPVHFSGAQLERTISSYRL